MIVLQCIRTLLLQVTMVIKTTSSRLHNELTLRLGLLHNTELLVAASAHEWLVLTMLG